MPSGAAAAALHPPRLVVVSAIGIAQILTWGSSYYLIAVLATPIAGDTQWPLSWIFAGLSLGFLVSGLVSPKVGRLIDARGGRPVLAASAVLIALGQLVLAAASGIPAYLAAWVVLGVGMGGCLYDPAFSTLGRLYGEKARGAITQVTLYGGFASTVCWPLSALLNEAVGWRGTCLAYAAIHLVVVVPLYLLGVPREAPARPAAANAAPAAGTIRRDQRLVFALLAFCLTLSSVIMTVISVNLLAMLQANGVALATAVAFGTLIGPAQVGARIIEAALGRRFHPAWTLVASCGLTTLGLAMLFGAGGLIAAGILLYGSGSGLRSIARGTVPLALFGPQGYATLMGRISVPTLIAPALSPALGAVLLDAVGPTTSFLVLFAAALLNLLPAVGLLGYALRRR